MAQQLIDYGAFVNDPTADIVRDAFEKTDDNFTELYGEFNARLKSNERFIPYVSTPGQTVLQNVIASANAYNVNFAVAKDTNQYISFIEYFGGVFTTEYIKRIYLLKPGYPSYGALSGNPITTADIILIDIVNTTPDNLFELGDIGAVAISDYVNDNGPYEIDGLTAFSATISSVEYLYIFSGANGTYGTGATPTTADNFIDINAQDTIPVETAGLPPLKITTSTYTVVVGSLGRLLEFTANDVTVTVPETLAEEAAEAGILSSLFRAKFQGTGTHTINAYNGVSENYAQNAVVWAELIGNGTEGWFLKELGTSAPAGTVTSVAVSGSDGIEVDSGSPITTSGTIALGLNKTNTLAFLNVEDGADVTDAVNVGSSIDGATAKTTPVDADTMPIIDSAASNVLKKVTWANIKATLKTYFDTLYGTIAQAKAEYLMFACSDEDTALTTGTAKITFRMPYAMTLADIRASVKTAPTGANLIVDVQEGGTTILSTLLSIDAGEKTSTTATTPPVISDSALADDAEMTVEITQIGSTIAGSGLKLTLIGTRV